MASLKEMGADHWHTMSGGPLSFHAHHAAAAAAADNDDDLDEMMMVACRGFA